MNLRSEYYETKLYPLQDGVLRCVSECNTEFFLTGGTAINRGYYNRRYSDDLDFFLSGGGNFSEQLDRVLLALDASGYKIDGEAESIRTQDFITVVVYQNGNPEARLKLDFVDDVDLHFGGFNNTGIFPKTDSLRNMLSNKITALFRFEAKDVADIHTICSNLDFSWPDIIEEARQKEAGIEAPLAAEILAGIPKADFQTIRWKVRQSWDDFHRDIELIAEDIIRGGRNTQNLPKQTN